MVAAVVLLRMLMLPVLLLPLLLVVVVLLVLLILMLFWARAAAAADLGKELRGPVGAADVVAHARGLCVGLRHHAVPHRHVHHKLLPR